MRLRARYLLTLLVATLVTIGLVTPTAGHFASPAGAATPLPIAHCLLLSYGHSAPHLLPATVRLSTYLLAKADSGGPAIYEADAMADNHHSFAVWRLVGLDSIDISLPTSITFRIPTRGDTLVGRGGWFRYRNLFVALLRSDFEVRAVEVPCQ